MFGDFNIHPCGSTSSNPFKCIRYNLSAVSLKITLIWTIIIISTTEHMLEYSSCLHNYHQFRKKQKLRFFVDLVWDTDF